MCICIMPAWIRRVLAGLVMPTLHFGQLCSPLNTVGRNGLLILCIYQVFSSSNECPGDGESWQQRAANLAVP